MTVDGVALWHRSNIVRDARHRSRCVPTAEYLADLPEPHRAASNTERSVSRRERETARLRVRLLNAALDAGWTAEYVAQLWRTGPASIAPTHPELATLIGQPHPRGPLPRGVRDVLDLLAGRGPVILSSADAPSEPIGMEAV